MQRTRRKGRPPKLRLTPGDTRVNMSFCSFTVLKEESQAPDRYDALPDKPFFGCIRWSGPSSAACVLAMFRFDTVHVPGECAFIEAFIVIDAIWTVAAEESTSQVDKRGVGRW